MAVPYELIVAEDIELGKGTVLRTMPAGGTATGNKVGPHTFQAAAFSARLAASQAVIGGAAAVTVQLSTEEYDSWNRYDPATYRFTPDVAGVYQFNAELAIDAFSGKCTVAITKNGSAFATQEMVRSSVAGRTTLSCLMLLNGSTDYVTLIVSHDDGTNSRNVTAARLSGFCCGKQ